MERHHRNNDRAYMCVCMCVCVCITMVFSDSKEAEGGEDKDKLSLRAATLLFQRERESTCQDGVSIFLHIFLHVVAAF